jgi:hypothetical protein
VNWIGSFIVFNPSPIKTGGDTMRKSMLFAVALLLAVSTVFGQDTKGKNNPDTNRHGLLFQVEGLNRLGLGSYGCGIGKKMFCGDYAFRPTLSFSTYKSSENTGIPDYLGDTKSRTKFGLDLDFLKQPNTPNRLQLYYGLGVGYEMEKGKQEPAHQLNATSTTTDSSGSTIRARGIVGAEFFISKHISISAEYQLGYDHRVITSQTSYTTIPPPKKTMNSGLDPRTTDGTVFSPKMKTTNSSFRIGASPRLTLGLYF